MGSGICRELLSMWCLELRDKNPALQRGIDGSSKRGHARRAEEEGQKQDMEREGERGRGRHNMKNGADSQPNEYQREDEARSILLCVI